jgi:hypothetical protein
MINREIMDQLKKKMPQSTVYSKIKKIRESFGHRISKEDAANVLAGELGIDISKYLTENEINRLSNLGNLPISIKEVEVKTKSEPKSLKLNIKKTTAEIPFIPKKLKTECIKMAESYQLFYFLENSIRYFILSEFKSEYPSKKWWNKAVPRRIREEVQSRKTRERKNRWHVQRGSHNIFYTNFGDLKDIIINNWKIFKDFFPDQNWIISRFRDLELSRNIIAHNNPLPKKEIDRIEIYFWDWIKQVGKQQDI